MILVDIGNSGLRATRVQDDCRFSDQRVFRLSWSAAVASQRKPNPEQESAPDQRWCELGDSTSFEWLVSRFEEYQEERWYISCVQRKALEQLSARLVSERWPERIRIVRYLDLPMKIDVEEPSKTGIDRLLAAWAAFELESEHANGKAPIIVVQAGTAVTLDLVDSDGVFRGGAIMPGLGLSLQLLAAGTDQLPWLGNHLVDSLPELPGKNTVQAISAGVNAALVGGAVHLIERYRTQAKVGQKLQVIVSGGDGRLLLPHIPSPAKFVDHLVLHGLSLLACRLEHAGNPISA
jgi:type III pantothenate kinase